MKFSHIEFLGTDQEVLDFTGAKAFDYETDYTNASVNVHLFGSHGKCNVPLGYHLVKDSDSAISVLTDEVSSYFDELEKENAELKEKYDTYLRENTGLKIHNTYIEKKLTEAKELLNMFLRLHYNPIVDEHTLFCKVEQFLNSEVEK